MSDCKRDYWGFNSNSREWKCINFLALVTRWSVTLSFTTQYAISGELSGILGEWSVTTLVPLLTRVPLGYPAICGIRACSWIFYIEIELVLFELSIPNWENKIFNIFIASFWRIRKARRWVHSTSNAFKIRRKVGRGSFLMETKRLNIRFSGSLCLPRCVRTAVQRER